MNRFEGRDLPSRLTRRALESILALWERASGTYLTYHPRPRRAADAGIWSDPRPDLPPFALVMQGPLLIRDDFTLDSAKLYRRTFPGVRLIVSTWKTEDPRYLQRFEDLGVEVVTSDLPPSPGQQNVNYQLVSSAAGLARAAALGAEYAMKTRTDQRIYAVNLYPLLMNLLDAFPLKSAGRQRRRLIGTGLTFKYRLYGFSDMLQFGHIDDVRLYWGASLSDTRVTPRPGGVTWRESSMDRVCEVYVVTEFLAALGHEVEWTLLDSWRTLAEHFCVVDPQTFDLYWPKYTRFRERRRVTYSARQTDEWLTFMDWLTLYTGRGFERDVPEWVLDARSRVMELPT